MNPNCPGLVGFIRFPDINCDSRSCSHANDAQRQIPSHTDTLPNYEVQITQECSQ